MKLSYIDAVRGWAILGVVVVHALDYGAGAQHLSPLVVSFCQSGARGVQLFFIISTFTLFLSMSNRQRQEKRPTLNCGGFPETFSPGDINPVGLLSTHAQANRIRKALRVNNPGEHHADCDIWALWRRT